MKLLALKNKKKGFTLLELLVVLAILAILIAIAVPVYKGQKEKAALTAHNANVRVLETAVESYRQDKGEYPKDVEQLKNDGYIKSVPKVPAGVVKNSKSTESEYKIGTNGNITPGEVNNEGNLNSNGTKNTTTDRK